MKICWSLRKMWMKMRDEILKVSRESLISKDDSLSIEAILE